MPADEMRADTAESEDVLRDAMIACRRAAQLETLPRGARDALESVATMAALSLPRGAWLRLVREES